jgi:hypothetical protein
MGKASTAKMASAAFYAITLFPKRQYPVTKPEFAYSSCSAVYVQKSCVSWQYCLFIQKSCDSWQYCLFIQKSCVSWQYCLFLQKSCDSWQYCLFSALVALHG